MNSYGDFKSENITIIVLPESNEPPICDSSIDISEFLEIVHDGDPLTNVIEEELCYNSYDPDYDALSYTWIINQQNYTGDCIDFSFVPGEYEIEIYVSDTYGASCSANGMITVVPEPNIIPSACIDNENIYYKPNIELDASCSIDQDGDSINFIWYSSLDGEILRTSAIMGEAILSQGTHIITLRVTDSQGEYTEQSIQISVSLSAESFDSDDSTLSSLNFIVTALLVVTISQIKRKY